jgi:hypothetical protein
VPSTAANVLAIPRRATLKTAVLECVWTGNPVPLGNRVRLVACRHSVPQAAYVYSLIRPLRTGLRRM